MSSIRGRVCPNVLGCCVEAGKRYRNTDVYLFHSFVDEVDDKNVRGSF